MEQGTQGKISNIEDLKKIIIQENINGSRLTNLRLPRDLTLGGTKPTKRVFTPNLNVIRNKDRGKIVTESEHRTKTLPHRSSKRLQKKAKLMQSEGIFSQGIGEGNRPNFSSGRSSLFRGGQAQSAATATLVMPTINKTRQHIDKHEEKILLETLLGDSDSESDSDNDLSITLPLEVSRSIEQSKELKSSLIPNRIKKEIPHEEDQHQMSNSSPVLDIKPIIKVEKPEKEEMNFVSCLHASKLYDDDNPAFTFVKLPDSFPGKVWKDDANDKNQDYTLQDMHDGPVGKILVRKSGKIELLVKNTKYLLTADNAGNTINAAVLFPGEQSISMEPSLVTLGSVEETMSISPNWDCLFDRAKKNPRFYY